jgi:hypothetical protein
MAYFKPKNPNLGKFWRVLGIAMEDVVTYILWPFCIFYGYLVYFPRFGILYQEKSVNTGCVGKIDMCVWFVCEKVNLKQYLLMEKCLTIISAAFRDLLGPSCRGLSMPQPET